MFADVPPGQYRVSVEKQGFKKKVHAAVDVLVNSTVRVDLKLAADFGHIRGLLSSTDGGNRTVELGAKITF